ncbi:MAG: 30S ribosomal protein S8 [Candidatus Yanofskybacteria bacterium]|nr:30S ribosomal protein S8 [Candidatus Yanofskybacteria bacterium]
MDPISDMLTRIKNAQQVKAERVLIPSSKAKTKIGAILKDLGFIEDVEKRKKKGRKVEHDYLDVVLRYQEGQGVINGIKIVSRPSRHLYIKAKEIRLVRSGHGMALISTPQGIMSSREARKNNLGGEVLFEIW